MLHPAVSQLHQALPTLHMDFPTVTWRRCANGEETEWGMGQNHMVVHGEDIRVCVYICYIFHDFSTLCIIYNWYNMI